MTARRWLFADQLGGHYLDEPRQPVLLVESTKVFARRRFHRQKAHLVLSALRHRAAELGDQALFIRTSSYRAALDQVGEPVSVVEPTSHDADSFVRLLYDQGLISEIARNPGFAMHRADFASWADGRKRLLMEDFYREQRRRHDLLMDGPDPVGGKWNLDHDNREAPPKTATLGLPEPWWPAEDDIDAEVRADLDRMQRDGVATFVGEDAPRRFAATASEAGQVLRQFVEHRLATFGPTEDAMLAADWTMSHSVLSPPLNLGLLHPVECAQAAEDAYRAGAAPLNSVEGFVRQLIGWRDYIWNVYWHFGPAYRKENALEAREPLPQWMWDLDADREVQARCLSSVLSDVREHGWVHHIPRLMVLGGYALQRGWDPAELTDWFHYSFVDGYSWVMASNVIGMSQHADGGRMATKPYVSGGAYIDRMSDYCGDCVYDPKVRVGDKACPYTAGYWAFLDRNADRLAGNRRMNQPLAGLRRLKDRHEVVEQERARGSDPP